MKRQIKFRGLLTSTKQWLIGDLYQDNYSGKSFITEFIGIESGESITELREVIPESVGQFTGLYDKNRVEIYEGKNSVKLEVYGIGHEFADVILENGQFHVCSGDLTKAPLYEFLRNPMRIIVFANNEREVNNV